MPTDTRPLYAFYMPAKVPGKQCAGFTIPAASVLCSKCPANQISSIPPAWQLVDGATNVTLNWDGDCRWQAYDRIAPYPNKSYAVTLDSTGTFTLTVLTYTNPSSFNFSSFTTATYKLKPAFYQPTGTSAFAGSAITITPVCTYPVCWDDFPCLFNSLGQPTLAATVGDSELSMVYTPIATNFIAQGWAGTLVLGSVTYNGYGPGFITDVDANSGRQLYFPATVTVTTTLGVSLQCTPATGLTLSVGVEYDCTYSYSRNGGTQNHTTFAANNLSMYADADYATAQATIADWNLFLSSDGESGSPPQSSLRPLFGPVAPDVTCKPFVAQAAWNWGITTLPDPAIADDAFQYSLASFPSEIQSGDGTLPGSMAGSVYYPSSVTNVGFLSLRLQIPTLSGGVTASLQGS